MSDASKHGPQLAPATALSEEAIKRNLIDALKLALSPEGQTKALETIARRGPRYGSDPADPSLLVRVSSDGKRERGHLIDGTFVSVDNHHSS
jgi:hypothetical protein